jgi:hypothetical protein
LRNINCTETPILTQARAIPSATVPLGGVHRLVRCVEQFRQRNCAIACHRNANSNANFHGQLADLDKCRCYSLEAINDWLCLGLRSNSDQQDHELVTTVTNDKVSAAQ